MEYTELLLTELVRLHYAGDTRSFDQSMRNALSRHSRSGAVLSEDCVSRLREVVPEDVQMGNVLR